MYIIHTHTHTHTAKRRKERAEKYTYMLREIWDLEFEGK